MCFQQITFSRPRFQTLRGSKLTTSIYLFSQAIIPREASRSILLGEASYTLIDDNGVEFYLSEPDKRRREKPTTEAEEKSSKLTSIKDVLRTDPHYQKARRDLGDVEVRYNDTLILSYFQGRP